MEALVVVGEMTEAVGQCVPASPSGHLPKLLLLCMNGTLLCMQRVRARTVL